MSRSKNLKALLFAPLVVLPLFLACSSGPAKPAASADDADTTEASAAADDTGADMAATEKSDESEAAKPEEKKADKKSDKKASADDDDDDESDAPPKDDSRTTAACDKVITDNRKVFKKCYEDVRKTKPDLKGSITIEVDIDSKGKVTKASIDPDSTIKEPKIDECMTAFVKTLTFPASTKGLEKTFTHEFIYNMGVKQ